MTKKPCVGCGQLVPEQSEFPYPECTDDCPLASTWRKDHVDFGLMIAAAREEGRAAGYAEAIEKLIMFRFDDESDLTGEQAVAIYDGMGGHRGQVYLNVNHKWYCSPTLSREFETMEAARDALCAHIAADIRALAPADKEKP